MAMLISLLQKSSIEMSILPGPNCSMARLMKESQSDLCNFQVELACS